MKPRSDGSALDRPWARLVALALFLAAAGLLAWIHRADLLPPETAAVAADDPVQLCLAERQPGIEQMRADGVITDQQAALFLERAAALCAHQVEAAPQQ
ncbi:MAG: hypothetical protein AAF495_13230 [Pseudomonadota bacterium]